MPADRPAARIARAGRRGRARRLGEALAFALAWAALCSGAPAGAALPEGAAVDLAREAWVPALLGADPAARFRALDEMRAGLQLARQALLLAVTDPNGPKERGKLLRHLAEFGQPEDIPALLAMLEQRAAERPLSALERRFTLGTVQALYPRYDPPADLAPMVSEFLFLQTKSPQPFDTAREGQWLLADRAFEEYHRANLPLDVILALKPLHERGFPDRAQLLAAMQKLLAPADWRAWQEALSAAASPLPPRVTLEGLLRVRVANRGERPLLTRLDFGIWRARFEADPPLALLYVLPGQEGRYEAPARVIAPVAEAPARIDLRLREAHRPPQPLFRKLLIPTMASVSR